MTLSAPIVSGVKAIVPADVAVPWLAEVRRQLQENPDCGTVDGPYGEKNQVRVSEAVETESRRPFVTLLGVHDDSGYALPLWIDAGSGLVAELSRMLFFHTLDFTTTQEED